MPLNKQKGNMYGFVTHTWNTIKGVCEHDCIYCYMKSHGVQANTRFDSSELRTDLGSGNFIFVGSSNDMYSIGIPREWIEQTLQHCMAYQENKYLFQSKNPGRMLLLSHLLPENSTVCTTIETNRLFDYNSNAPSVITRAIDIGKFSGQYKIKRMLTIEPIIDFDLSEMIRLVEIASPEIVNIGADSKGHNLPEPSWDKVQRLISELEKIATVNCKPNLKRLMK